MKKIFILILVIILVVLGYSVLLNNQPIIPKEEAPKEEEVVFCPQDVLLCPDGSYVSRSAPTCAFTACPDSANDAVPDVDPEGRLK